MKQQYIYFGIALTAMISFPFFGADAAPVLTTISESSQGARTAWWPHRFEAASPWVSALKRCGIDVIDPAANDNPPRLSPTVYGQMPLSPANARTLASLFGTKNVLNGEIVWQCEPAPSGTHCIGNAAVTLHAGASDVVLNKTAASTAADENSAKDRIRTQIAFDIASDIHAKTGKVKSIPALTHKPVVMFDPMPDADTLVSVRKRLKRIPGVENVAEIFVSEGVLAFEINPGKPLSSDAFTQMIQVFIADTGDDFTVREILTSDAGSVIEIAKY